MSGSKNDALLAWAIKHARRFDLGGLTLQVAPPEYVIVKKLEIKQGLGMHVLKRPKLSC